MLMFGSEIRALSVGNLILVSPRRLKQNKTKQKSQLNLVFAISCTTIFKYAHGIFWNFSSKQINSACKSKYDKGDKSKIIAGHFFRVERIDGSQTSVFSFVLYLMNACRSFMYC